MSVVSGPSISTSGLLVQIDPTSTKSYDSRENLLTNSQQFDNASWTKQFATITPNATVAPDGTLTAARVVEDANNGEHTVYAQFVASNVTRTYSVYLKAGERTTVVISFSNFINADTRGTYNLTTGATTASGNNADFTNTSASMVDVGNGWWRCSLTTTKGSVNTTMNPTVMAYNGSTTVFASSTATGYFIWGAQLEQGSLATTYAPTTTTSITRATSAIDVSGNGRTATLGAGATYRASTKTFNTNGSSTGFLSLAHNPIYYTNNWSWDVWVKFNANTTGYQGIIWGEGVTNTAGGESGYQYLLTLYNYTYFHIRIQNATTSFDQTNSSTIAFTPTNWTHLVWTFENGVTKLYVNGSLFYTDTSRGLYSGSGTSRVMFGCRNDGAFSSNSDYGNIGFYSRAISAQEVLQSFTARRLEYGI